MELLVYLRTNIICVTMLIFIVIYSVIYNCEQGSKNNFLGMGIAALVINVFSIVAILAVNSSDIAMETKYFIHRIYLCLEVFAGVASIDYIASTYLNKKIRHTILTFMLLEAIVESIHICNSSLIWVDGVNTAYYQGNAIVSCFIRGFVVLIVADIFLLINYKNINTMTLCVLILYSIAAAIYYVLQIYNPEFIFSDAVHALIALGYFVSIENPVMKAHKKSLVDMATGLSNRNCYERDVKIIKKRLESDDEKLYCVVCDLNNLKYVNDNMGHMTGDRMIFAAGDILSTYMTGKTYRVGGDEFMVIGKDYTAAQIDEGLSEVARLCELQNDDYDGALSMAMGYAIKKDNETFEDMVKRADAAMYENKVKMKQEQDSRFDLRQRQYC
ncbi:MAG: GGDEF domain-containing protein [Pseudobutyrivibrio sp.]|nr:GGDEF domain-containing protein [Pseudobutyrivibrio sp.]